MFGLDSKDSLIEAIELCKEIMIPRIIVGHKSDLEISRVYTKT